MSFPSGHACAAFAGFGFLALYFNAKFGVFGAKPYEEKQEHGKLGPGGMEVTVEEVRPPYHQHARIPHWRLVLFAAPVLVAVVIAASKVRDMWHHPHEVVFGACVGTLFALMAFRMVYRGVWDQKRNHLAREVGGKEHGKTAAEVGESGPSGKGYVV